MSFKVRYVVHCHNLDLYLQLGLVVTQIHRVLAVEDFNTHQHSLVGSSFLKEFFQLINNSVFGKTQENLRKYVQVELIKPPTIYYIEDTLGEPVQGTFYEVQSSVQEIHCIERVLLKWKGYSSEFNSWIPLADLEQL